MLKWRKKVITAKVETSYGADAAPTGAANAILATKVQLTPIEGQEITRELERPHFGGQPQILVNKHVSLQFEVEAAGSGAAGTAPAYGPLLRACALSQTLDATPGSEKVVYRPVSEGHESASIHFNLDGTLHQLLGARGNVTLRVQAGQIPKFVFSFKGLFVAPSATALPAADFSAFMDPQEISDANTPAFTIDGYQAVMQEFELDLANQVEGRFLVGQEAIVITDRQTRGSCNIEAPALGTKDVFALATSHARVPLSLVHGSGAGNVIEITAPEVQLGRPGYTEVQGIAHLTTPLIFAPTDAGDDEVTITIR
ncbi:phage tail tube protein [Arenibaculum sp.]|jgi:hypothetical protein|uniref:phage tail tube protein n=1 Tax=Arenibaculum sp. TaxID=2865862 RepID=UPI002E13E0D1|nr:phage tail tube protein [Arenibaculum sp.]